MISFTKNQKIEFEKRLIESIKECRKNILNSTYEDNRKYFEGQFAVLCDVAQFCKIYWQ